MSTASFDVSDISGANHAREPAADRTPGPAAYRDEDFPGCESFHLPAGRLEHYEGRLEFWDGDTETAWKVCEPTTIDHEEPSRLLAQTAGQFAMLRGSRIACFGSADLLRVDATTGRKHWLMQADEVLYLHPDRVRLMRRAIDVDADPLPDVVLEVDHTTDVRRRKLGIYKGSGFPEIRVPAPWEASVRAPVQALSFGPRSSSMNPFDLPPDRDRHPGRSPAPVVREPASAPGSTAKTGTARCVRSVPASRTPRGKHEATPQPRGHPPDTMPVPRRTSERVWRTGQRRCRLTMIPSARAAVRYRH